MEDKIFSKRIAQGTGIDIKVVINVLALIDDGCTIPFIARYRKERTGGLDEVQIGQISLQYEKLKELAKRKETILKTIEEQGKLTPELKKRIDDCWDATELEDIYLPYKPKRRTRAQVAREQGLEPLATTLLLQREQNPRQAAQKFVKGDVKDADMALKGAQDIIAEMVSEDEGTRNKVRGMFRREAYISSKLKVKNEKLKMEELKAFDEKAAKYSDYFDWREPLKRCSGNRLLAMRRGEAEGVLKISISLLLPPEGRDISFAFLKNKFNGGNSLACKKLIDEACEDSLKRLLLPSIENEFAASSKEKADKEAIEVFAANLRQLLLDAPLGQKRVMGIDPGFRTGCKVVCLDAQGNLLYHTVLFLSNKQGGDSIQKLSKQYRIEAYAIGNGTASRETSDYLKSLGLEAPVFVVSEDGASVYSASKVAREEFPDEDVTVRGAVSIARRLMDPLAELVKIDPKSIGVGQYQHDVDQGELKKSLDRTVESCVNKVGVDINTASKNLLTYVSGVGPTLAQNIVDYRKENGAFTSRAQIKKVPRLGPAAFQQCAGFLRIQAPTDSPREGKYNPLDGSAVHPESYHIVEQMAKDLGCTVKNLMQDAEKRKQIKLEKYVTEEVGMPTLTDIMQELEKPGRDPRAEIEVFEFDKSVHTPDDLFPGMILPGIVTNMTKFGAFVDIGVHQDGLVHISQMADKFVSDPQEIVHLHEHVRVRVVEVDRMRKRISLSMKNMKV